MVASYEVVKKLPVEYCTDILLTRIRFFFEDDHVEIVEINVLEDAEDFIQCAQKLVPEIECMPVCIATLDNYEEVDEE